MRLSDAVAAGHPIRAVVRETALNQDGKTETITSPSEAAQTALIRECYRKAGIDPLSTQYFEAHGTGTQTGDPIEARAIASVFTSGRELGNELRIGSIKTNIGHTEATSGVASIIKVVLALENGKIPPSINFEKPNTKLSLEEWRLKVATELEPWPVGPSGVRYASINNFGYGGSNAHAIIEQADSSISHVATRRGTANGTVHSVSEHPNGISKTINAANGTVHGNGIPIAAKQTNGTLNTVNGLSAPLHMSKLLILSARDEPTCQKMVSNLKEYLEQSQPADAEAFLESLVFTLGQHRSLLPWIAAHPVSITQGLDKVIKALDTPQFKPNRSASSGRLRVGMVFTGQGAQWYAMGREMISTYPKFRATLEEGDRYLKSFGADWSLMEEFGRDAKTTRVNETGLSIPICVALQISLFRLLQSWGVDPVAVTSHSSGEIAAAFAVNAISYRAAMAIAYYRSVLADDKSLRGPVQGGMVAVGLGLEDTEQYLQQLTGDGKAVVACINSPSSITVSGDLSAVEEVEAMAKSNGVFASRLRVDTGYHSHHMESICDAYRQAISDILAEETCTDELDSVAFSSPVTGGRIFGADELTDPEHWVSSLVQPVEFVDAFTDMVLADMDPSGSSVDVIIELGPHTALGGPIREILELPEFNGVQIPYFGCLVRYANALESIQSLAGNLLRGGLRPDMEKINFPLGKGYHVKTLTDLPSYPWNHQNRHWFEPRFNKAVRERTQVPHDLLGSLVPGTNPVAPSWRHTLRASETPWTRDHVVQSQPVYPGAGYVCLAIEAMTQTMNIDTDAAATSQPSHSKEISSYHLRNIEFLQGMVVPESAAGIEIQTTLRPVSDENIGSKGWKHFEVHSITPDNRWTQHARGLISVEFEGSSDASFVKLDQKRRKITGYALGIDPGDVFSGMRSVGINHGPMFQNLKTVMQYGRGRRSVSTLAVGDHSVQNDVVRNHVIHPTTLDAIFVAAYTALPGVGSGELSPQVPRSIGNLRVLKNISRETGHVFKAYTTLDHADAQKMEANISLINDDGDDDDSVEVLPVLEIEGLVCQSLGSVPLSAETKAAEKDVCSKVEWAPDMSLASPAILESIKKPLCRSVHPDEEGIIMDLRRVCIYFIQDALAQLTKSDVQKLETHQTKYHKWMQDQMQLALAGHLGHGSASWTQDSISERRRQIDHTAQTGVNGEMVWHLGPHLVAMLRGETVPLELMMENNLLTRFYESAIKMPRVISQAAELLRHVVHKNPRARILEIGAGTGSATRAMLKVLGTAETGGPLAAWYHFTDISPGFFDAAREEFAPWSDLLTFEKLDIEKNPEGQNFALGSYDVVVACQVLHATRSMTNTMTNVRSLMKPGGTLLLVETTQNAFDNQFIFGLLPGWWLSEEPERQTSPLLSVQHWDDLLKSTGFTGVDMNIRDCESDDMYAMSAIMSTVPAAIQPKLVSNNIVLVISNQAPPPAPWLETLQKSIGGSGPLPEVRSLEDAEAKEVAYGGKIYVFVGEVDRPILYRLDQQALEGIKSFATNCKGLIWVTRGGAVEGEKPELALAAGLLRSLRNEYVGRQYVTLDLDPKAPLWSDASVSTIVKVLEAAFGNSDGSFNPDAPLGEFEYAERNGAILVPRLYKDVVRNQIIATDATDFNAPDATSMEPLHQEHRPLCMHVGVPGMLDTLAFGDDTWTATHGDSLPVDFVEIEPRAYGVNFRDVLVAMGQLNDRTTGLECAGIITRVGSQAAKHGYAVGDKVLSLLCGPFGGTRAHIEWTNVVHLPAGLEFDDAASLPVVFCTAYMCLIDIARMRRDQSVLIHAAAGGVGQAAIQLAQHIGAEIFATVGSPEKRKLIMDTYGIPADHIFGSRDKSFARGVLAATGGRGVDVVLNSLAGTLLQESFNLVAQFGHFVEIGKRDLESNSHLEMLPFTRNISFSSFDLGQLMRHKGHDVHRAMTAIAQLIKDKAIKPVHPVTVYPISDVNKAFRLLQTGKHLGKIVLSVGSRDMVPVLPPPTVAKLSSHSSYLIVGGAGGIGQSIAYWMAAHGAKNLIVLSRSASSSNKTGTLVAELQEVGCRAMPVSCDVADEADLTKALRKCKEEGLPPVRGIVQAAMVLQVSLFIRWNLTPKVLF